MTFANFPEKLRRLTQWVLWKIEMKDGRETKVPYSPKRKNIQASSTDPHTWGSFEEGISALSTGGYDGIGFVFDTGVVGIDLDQSLDEKGKMKPWAEEIFNLFDSYAEISPSGRGLHLIIEADIDFAGKGRKKWIDKEKGEAVECYTKGRYFTATGNVFMGRKELKHVDEPTIFTWHKNFFDTKEKLIVQISAPTAVMPEDRAIVEFMRQAKNGSRFKALFDRGEFFGLPSHSEADMSLVSSLMFFCRNDTAIVDRIFRSSALMRKKWDREGYRTELFKKCRHNEVMDWSRPEECDEPEDELEVVKASDLVPENIRWIWDGRLATGKLCLFQGEPDQGKSQVTISIASIISIGGTFPDGAMAESGSVLFITAEDSATDTIVPRLMSAGANTEKIFILQWVLEKNGKKVSFNFETHIPELKRTVAKMPGLKLIVVDPISAFMGKIDSNSNSEVRGLLKELMTMAEEVGCAVILISHNNKNSGQRALTRAIGSVAWGAAVRMGFIFGEAPGEEGEEKKEDDEKVHAMAHSKKNLSKQKDTLLYRIISDVITAKNGDEIYTSKVVWTGASEHTAQEIMDYRDEKTKKVGRPSDKFTECVSLVRELTADRPVISPTDLNKLWEELRFQGDFKDAMVKKAQKSLGYKSIVDKGRDVSWIKDGSADMHGEINPDDVPL